MIFDEHNPGGSGSFNVIDISGISTVRATGGAGAAGIGGGSGDNNYLVSLLAWDDGDDLRAGNIGHLSVESGSLVIASAGNNCICDESEIGYDHVVYLTVPDDIGHGGAMLRDEQPGGARLFIDEGTVLSSHPDKDTAWVESYRRGASVNGFAPDKNGAHLDGFAGDNAVLYRVSLEVPGAPRYEPVYVSVSGYGSINYDGAPYYYDKLLYTDENGKLWLWLRPGIEDGTMATVTAAGETNTYTYTYTYTGTSREDHTGSLTLDGERLYTITFITGKGTPVSEITGKTGTPVSAPEEPTRIGYTFAGWDQEIPELMPDYNLTITAKWIRNVTIGTYLPLKARMKKAGRKYTTLIWQPVDGATTYTVFGCSDGENYKILGTTGADFFTADKLRPGTTYKFVVAAYNGEYRITKSKVVYITTAGGKPGNPTTVRTDRTGVTLAVGRSRKITATTEELIDHRRNIRFESANPQIASVTLNGRITAVQPGVTYVYAYAQNGVSQRIRVTVVK